MDSLSAASSSASSTAQVQQAVAVYALRKALDLQAGQMAQLLASVAPASGSNPPHLGNQIDVTA